MQTPTERSNSCTFMPFVPSACQAGQLIGAVCSAWPERAERHSATHVAVIALLAAARPVVLSSIHTIESLLLHHPYCT